MTHTQEKRLTDERLSQQTRDSKQFWRPSVYPPRRIGAERLPAGIILGGATPGGGGDERVKTRTAPRPNRAPVPLGSLVSSILGYTCLICRSGSRGWPGVLDARRGERSEPERASSTDGGRAVGVAGRKGRAGVWSPPSSHVLNGYLSIEARTTSTGKGKNT